LIEKETNSSPQSSQRTLRKKIKNYLCVLSGLCGEILLGMASDFMEFHTRGSEAGEIEGGKGMEFGIGNAECGKLKQDWRGER
jgi:hypothetical protein